MKNKRNITLSADENLIRLARIKCMSENRSLNDAFREWLESLVVASSPGKEYQDLMNRLKDARPGRKFTRDEMNER